MGRLYMILPVFATWLVYNRRSVPDITDHYILGRLIIYNVFNVISAFEL